jgi:hypothetical protein
MLTLYVTVVQKRALASKNFISAKPSLESYSDKLEQNLHILGWFRNVRESDGSSQAIYIYVQEKTLGLR